LADESNIVLATEGLDAGYGKKQVLFGVDFRAPANAIVAIIGPNGAGKSTLLKVLSGLVPVGHGAVLVDGRRVSRWSPKGANARRIAYVPQGHRVFDELTVKENLEIGGLQLSRSELRSRLDKVLQLFPGLAGRLKQTAGTLSGGERQMVAFGSAMIKAPSVLLLDEPSMALSPGLSREVFDKIGRINGDLGVTVLLVEQKVREIMAICSCVYVLRLGRVAFVGTPGELMSDPARLTELFL
jgi:ABC-type branched-subunit amino acid transport system ATPase component